MTTLAKASHPKDEPSSERRLIVAQVGTTNCRITEKYRSVRGHLSARTGRGYLHYRPHDTNADVVKAVKESVVDVFITYDSKTFTLSHNTQGDLVMRCSTNSPDNIIYSNNVYGAITNIASKIKHPNLVHALTQYLLYRAMQCIGGTHPCSKTIMDTNTICGDALSNEMIIDLNGPPATATNADFVECVRVWMTPESETPPLFNVDPDGALTFSIAANVILKVPLNDYAVEYGWLVLHLFMAYANLHVALENTYGVVLQEDLLRLLEPFLLPR